MTDREIVESLFRDLFPISRSLMGNGVRDTLARLRDVTPFEVKGVASGTECFDWTVPQEWHVSDAYIEDADGNRIVDIQDSNLHLVGYSTPVDETMDFAALAPHLHSLKDLPDAIPYRTSYYKENWGFCLSHAALEKIDRSGCFHVKIDSRFDAGELNYGEAVLPGTSGREFLFTTYCCHPSLGNDNLSGIVLWTLLLRKLRERSLRHSYRFVIAPETIGTIAYLARNMDALTDVEGGYVLTTVAGPGEFSYKASFAGDSTVDRVARRMFAEKDLSFIEYPFDIKGSDERQYASPHFRIPMGLICKDKFYEYDYYHTSLDNLEFIQPEFLLETLALYESVVDKLESDQTYRSLSPYAEPMLGKRGLYPSIGGAIAQKAQAKDGNHESNRYETAAKSMTGNELDAMLWLMFYADGVTSLIDIAERTGLPSETLSEAAEKLVASRLIEAV